jgi:hypothetical protein
MPKIKGNEDIIILFGFAIALGFSIIMVWTFFTAYFSGNFKVVIDINSIGEAHIEAVVIPIAFAISVAGFVCYCRNNLRYNPKYQSRKK